MRVDEGPTLRDGVGAVQKLIVYPERAKQAGIEGIVLLRIIVNKDSTATNIEVVKGIGYGCDEESVRALRLPRYIPAQLNGRDVNSVMNLPIRFRLK